MIHSEQILELAEDFYKQAKVNKWIPKDLKKDRFKGWTLARMKSRYSALSKKEDKTKAEISEMHALALGIRFKGGDVPGGEKKKGLKGKKYSFKDIEHLYSKYAGDIDFDLDNLDD